MYVLYHFLNAKEKYLIHTEELILTSLAYVNYDSYLTVMCNMHAYAYT